MSTFVTANMPTSLVNELKALAKLPRAPIGYLPALAKEYGYAYSTLRNAVSDLRGNRRDEQDGAAGVIPPGCACGPERAGAMSGHDAGARSPSGIVTSPGVGVSSLELGARGESRAVAPAAGAGVPAPAAVFSGEDAPETPGLCWARAAMQRGLPLEKVLRTGGDQLSWRDRAYLRQAAP